MIRGEIPVGNPRSQLPTFVPRKQLKSREHPQVTLNGLLVFLREDGGVEDEIHHHPVVLEGCRLRNKRQSMIIGITQPRMTFSYVVIGVHGRTEVERVSEGSGVEPMTFFDGGEVNRVDPVGFRVV